MAASRPKTWVTSPSLLRHSTGARRMGDAPPVTDAVDGVPPLVFGSGRLLEEIRQVQHPDVAGAGDFQAGAKLQDAAGVGGDDDLGARLEDVRGLALLEARGQRRFGQVVTARAAAADVALGH